MKAEFSIIVNGVWHEGINHPQSNVDTLFPEEGEGSLKSVIEEYGDDLTTYQSSAKLPESSLTEIGRG